MSRNIPRTQENFASFQDSPRASHSWRDDNIPKEVSQPVALIIDQHWDFFNFRPQGLQGTGARCYARPFLLEPLIANHQPWLALIDRYEFDVFSIDSIFSIFHVVCFFGNGKGVKTPELGNQFRFEKSFCAVSALRIFLGLLVIFDFQSFVLRKERLADWMPLMGGQYQETCTMPLCSLYNILTQIIYIYICINTYTLCG